MKCKLVQVIETVEHRGDGSENDPHRIIKQHWSVDGLFLMEEYDEWQVKQKIAETERMTKMLGGSG